MIISGKYISTGWEIFQLKKGDVFSIMLVHPLFIHYSAVLFNPDFLPCIYLICV